MIRDVQFDGIITEMNAIDTLKLKREQKLKAMKQLRAAREEQ